MIADFYKDLKKGHEAEEIVLDSFAALTDKYEFENVSEDPECYHKGDIKAIAADGREIFIEVKNDSRICDTQNVLCEYGVYYKDTNSFGNGNMSSTGDIYCVLSASERKIYIFYYDFLRQHYKEGQHRIIHHYDQDTYCHLLSIEKIKSEGGMIGTVSY